MAETILRSVKVDRDQLEEIRNNRRRRTHLSKAIQDLVTGMVEQAYNDESAEWDSIAKLAGFPGGLTEAHNTTHELRIDYLRGVIDVLDRTSNNPSGG